MTVTKKDESLRQTRDFTRVLDGGTSRVNEFLVLRTLESGLGFTRHGFIISKRVGGAVIRNRLRRRLREITRMTHLKTGWDIVLIARPKAGEADFNTLKQAVEMLLRRSGLLAQEDEKNYHKAN